MLQLHIGQESDSVVASAGADEEATDAELAGRGSHRKPRAHPWETACPPHARQAHGTISRSTRKERAQRRSAWPWSHSARRQAGYSCNKTGVRVRTRACMRVGLCRVVACTKWQESERPSPWVMNDGVR